MLTADLIWECLLLVPRVMVPQRMLSHSYFNQLWVYIHRRTVYGIECPIKHEILGYLMPNLSFETEYEDNQITNIKIYRHGVLRRDLSFQNGQLHGDIKMYDEHRRLRSIISYHQDYKLASTGYFPSGRKGFFENDSIRLYWYDQIPLQLASNTNLKTGQTRRWDPDGTEIEGA